MDDFRSVLKKRMAFAGAFNGMAIVFIVLTGLYAQITTASNKDISDMIHGFQTGFFIGIQIIMLVLIGRYRKALKSESELKKLYIEEKDERRKLIQDKIGNVGFNLTIGIVAVAAIIAGFFQTIVFLTLVGVVIFMVLLKGVLKIYYTRKY